MQKMDPLVLIFYFLNFHNLHILTDYHVGGNLIFYTINTATELLRLGNLKVNLGGQFLCDASHVHNTVVLTQGVILQPGTVQSAF